MADADDVCVFACAPARIPDESEAFQAKEVTRDKPWCLDNGCTSHLCSDSDKFTHFTRVTDNKLNLANNSSTVITGRGIVQLNAEVEGNSKHVNLENTLHVPDLRTNLLSVSKITDRGFKIIFQKESARVIDPDGITKFAATRIDGLYYLQEDKYDCRAAINKFDRISTESSTEIWHCKMGYVNIGDLLTCNREGAVRAE